jgi:hypothetical protein
LTLFFATATFWQQKGNTMKLLSRLKTLLPMSERLRWNVLRAQATGEKELGYVNALYDHSSVPVDIGANMGIYSYLMRQHSKSVIAFEPNPFYANVVRRAIEAAVSDREERRYFACR